MRILHLVACPTLTGAAEPAWDLVRGQRRLGAQVDLHIDTRREGNWRGLLEAAGEVVPEALVLSTKAGPLAALRDLWRLRRLLRGYDVVHTHLSHDHALAVFARGLRRRPLLVRTVHAERALATSVGRRFLLRRADGLTVAAETHRQHLVARGFAAERVTVLPGSVDPGRFFPDPAARARAREDLGLGPEHFALGCVARFQAGRRHEVMLDALALARRTHPELRLVLIGHGETEPGLRDRAARPDLSGAVLFPGYKRQDLNDYLNALDAAVWLVPGNDATSRAVLQAMAVALPVVGGAEGAIPETVLAGETGRVVEPDDHQGLAEAFVTLAADPERARGMGRAGLERARARYTVDARAALALGFYERLLGSSGAR